MMPAVKEKRECTREKKNLMLFFLFLNQSSGKSSWKLKIQNS